MAETSDQRVHFYKLSVFAALFIWAAVSLITLSWKKDFLQDYFSAKAFLLGDSIYGSSAVEMMKALLNKRVDNFHPPALILFFIPLAFLPYSLAYLFASGLIVFGYITTLTRLCADIKIPAQHYNKAIIALLFWSPFIMGIHQANVSSLIAIALISIWYLYRSRMPVSAGIVLGTISAIKLFPLYLCGFFLIKREFRIIAYALLSLAVVELASIFVFGLADFRHYFLVIVPECIRIYGWSRANISLSGMIGSWFLSDDAISPNLLSSQNVEVIKLILSIGITYLTFRLSWRAQKNSKYDELLFGLWCCGMLLVSPVIWQYSLIVILLPVFHLAKLYFLAGDKHKLFLLGVLFMATWIANYDATAVLVKHHGREALTFGFVFLNTKIQSIGFLGLTLLIAFEIRNQLRSHPEGLRNSPDKVVLSL